MEIRARLRSKSRELSHFKSLVVFVFATYGILVPLWFVFHGNKLLGNNNEAWPTVVLTSTRIARQHLGKNEHIATKRLQRHSRIAIKRPSKRPVTYPRPLRSFYVWPMAHQQTRKTVARTYRHAGRLLSMKWEHLCCQTINCLRKFPLFPLLPSKTKFIRSLKLSEEGRLYGLRIAGLLRPKETGSYSFHMKCSSTCEFWLSENEYPVRSRLMRKTVRGIPVKHDFQLNENSTPIVFTTHLQAGRVYFMDILLTVYRYTEYPFEVLCRRPSKKTFEPLTKNFFTGFQKKPETLINLLKLYAHSPSVKMTSFLESIEEPGEDDDDFTILDEKQTDSNMSTSIFFNASFEHRNFSKFPFPANIVIPSVEECPNKPLFLKNKTLVRYAGVWNTHLSSVFPRDRTGCMMCIGNRYPVDCLGNKVVPQETVSRFLTCYNKKLSSSKIR